MQKLAIAAILATLFAVANSADAARFKSNSVAFDNVTATVEITTNEGEEVEVKIAQPKTYRPIDVSFDHGVVKLKGEKWRDEETRNCCDDRIMRTVDLRLGRELRREEFDDGFFADYPAIKISMPRKGAATFVDARMKLSMGALEGPLSLDACYVNGETGDVSEAVVGVVAGSRLSLGDIGAGLEVDISGDAAVMAGKAASVDVDIAGSGGVVLGDIDGMLDVSIAGSGSVRSSRLEGPLTARIAGSGSVSVQNGRADRLTAVIDGSGGVFFNGLAVQPDLRLFGSSEVRMDSVKGRVTRAGGGEVYVGGKLVPKD
jgi:hypothetical protein